MTTDRLAKVHEARPFVPFHIVMADGTRYLIDHPEVLAYVKGGRTGVVFDREGVATILDLLLMTALEGAPRRLKHRRSA